MNDHPDAEAIKLVNVEVAKQLGFVVIQFSALDFRLSEAILFVTGDHLQEQGDQTRKRALGIASDGIEQRIDLLLKKIGLLKPTANVLTRWSELGGLLKDINTKRNDLMHGLWRNFGEGFAGVTRRRRGSETPAEFQTWKAKGIQALALACHELTADIGAAMCERELSEARIENGLQPQPDLEGLSADDYIVLTGRHTDNVRACLAAVDELNDLKINLTTRKQSEP